MADSTTATICVNGKITAARDASVSVLDHGFLYGEGVYETMRTYHLQPFLFDRHMRRLRHSAALMDLMVPYTDRELLDRVEDTMEAHARRHIPGDQPRDATSSRDRAVSQEAPSSSEKYIRMLLTRGVGELSYRLEACPSPTLVIIVKPLEAPPERSFRDGITVALVGIRRNHPQALNPMIKSNNLLNNALAMQEAYRRGADEALMLNQAGELVECSQSNFFLVRNGRVLTPPVSAGLLPGITREFVLEMAAELRIPAAEARLTPADLRTADEAFLTGTTREITPVVVVDGRPIGRGNPGEITTRLLASFRQRVADLVATR
jgi:branched-chain amino acid aminotransferase